MNLSVYIFLWKYIKSLLFKWDKHDGIISRCQCGKINFGGRKKASTDISYM